MNRNFPKEVLNPARLKPVEARKILFPLIFVLAISEQVNSSTQHYFRFPVNLS